MKFVSEFSTSEQWALKNEICPEASDDQINYFLRVCDARGVDPFSGLLYMQRRLNSKTNKWKCSISPTVDGSRAAASRTGFYAGSDEPEFDSEDGDKPNWCRVTVYRRVKNDRFAFTAKCRWREFCPKPPNDFQWKDKPYHMLSKVTEVQALRKAFPECIPAAGEDDYDDEVETTDTPAPTADQTEKAQLALDWSKALQAFAPLGLKEADLLGYLNKPREQVTPEDLVSLREHYDNLKREKT